MPANAGQIFIITGVISQKGWDLPENNYSDQCTNTEAILIFLNNLPEKYVDYAIDIIEGYDIYRNYIIDIPPMVGFIRNISEIKENVIIIPVKSLDSDSVKSSSRYLYDLRVICKREGIKASFLDTPYSTRIKENSNVFAIDDFVGSGSQFLSMIDDMIRSNVPSIPNGIIAAVIQKEGKDNIERSGYEAYSQKIRRKAISEVMADRIGSVEEAIRIYSEIESLVKISDEYNLGFRKTEAAVSMLRTPNNTLPIFWSNGGGKWPAPFPR